MISEEEFKELTESLETVGHYIPTVRDMFQFLVDRKGYFRVDPENPKAWRGYAGVKLDKGQEDAALHLDYFPEAGRFELAIREILITHNTAAGTHYEEMAKGFGLDLQLTATTWSTQFVITLPAEELIAEFEKLKKVTNPLLGDTR